MRATPAQPLVSVLVPIYNSAPYLPACLDSIAAQTYENLDIVLVDDASSDGSGAIAARFAATDPRVRYLCHDSNLGNRENFRITLELSRGELIKFVCGDDLLAPEVIETMVAVMQHDPEVSLVTSRRSRIDCSGRPLPDPPHLQVQSDVTLIEGRTAGDLLLSSLVNWIGEPTTVMFRSASLGRRELYQIGNQRPARNLDVVWWLKVMMGRRMAYINRPLSSFRIHEAQQSSRATLQADLVLSWYDIILGSADIGYLQDPGAERAALESMVRLLDARLAELAPAAIQRADRIYREASLRMCALTQEDLAVT